MKAPSTRPTAVLGLDVGKSSHWACLIDRDGEVLASAPVRNREAELDALFASAPAGTLVVVDQFRNIGSLAVRRARAAGLGVAHLPGLAASRAAGLFAGEAKTDERDAAVIARTALGVPDSLSGVPGRGEALEAARALSSQRDHVVACATRDKNRLRAVLLESCPALEAAVDLSDRRWLELLAGFGGAWGIARSGAEGPRAEVAGEAAAASTAPPPALVEAENSRSGSWPPGYRRPSTRPGPSRPRRRRCSRATRPTRACSPCPASARGPRRSSRCRSTSGGSRTTTTWPRTAA